MEAFSIASAAVSLVLGAYAIWLSVVFYRMSTESSNQIKESSRDLNSSVSKLEKLFEHLYSDTFSMMRDTYSDMRKHVWPETVRQESGIIDQIEARADNKIEAIRKEVMEQIEAIGAQAGGAEAKTDLLRTELSPLINEAIVRSRNVEAEAQEETIRDSLVSHIRMAGAGGIAARDLLEVVYKDDPDLVLQFGAELKKLKAEGIVRYDSMLENGWPRKAGERIFYATTDTKRQTQ